VRSSRFKIQMRVIQPVQIGWKNPTTEGYRGKHPECKLHIIEPIMRKTLFFGMLLLALFTSSCGEAVPAVELTPLPSASTTPTTALPLFNASIPYGKNIRFEQISLDDGLSQSVVNVILQDRKGFLWVGTDDGLNRYDGYGFKIYKPDSSTSFGLSDRSITDIVEDEQGYLWVATRSGGLNRFDPSNGQFTHYTHNKQDEQSISSNQIYSLCLDESGIWIGTDNGLDFLDFETGQVTHYRASTEIPPDARSLSSNSIRILFKDSSGNLWIGTSNAGLNMFNKSNNTFTVLDSCVLIKGSKISGKSKSLLLGE